jgi:hypothetical protein
VRRSWGIVSIYANQTLMLIGPVVQPDCHRSRVHLIRKALSAGSPSYSGLWIYLELGLRYQMIAQTNTGGISGFITSYVGSFKWMLDLLEYHDYHFRLVIMVKSQF